MGSDETTAEKVKGLGKELAGKVTGSEELTEEGEQQQKKAQKQEDAERLQEAADRKRAEASGHAGAQQRRSGT